MKIQHAETDMDCITKFRTIGRSDIPLAPARVLIYLMTHSNGWRVSQDVMATDLGIAVRTVRVAMAWLKENGYLVCDGHTATVHITPKPAESAGIEVETGRICRKKPAKSAGKNRQNLPPISKKKNKEEKTSLSDESDAATAKVTAKASKAAVKSALEAEFEEWWKLYPRKEAKIVAKAAYVKARAKTDLDTLTAGAKAYAELMASKPTDANGRSCIAHGATWLNQERWTDESIAHAVPQSLEDLTAWLRDCYRTPTIKSIEERTGMTYPNPMPPVDCDDRAAWRDSAKRQWITENRPEILRRAGMKAVS